MYICRYVQQTYCSTLYAMYMYNTISCHGIITNLRHQIYFFHIPRNMDVKRNKIESSRTVSVKSGSPAPARTLPANVRWVKKCVRTAGGGGGASHSAEAVISYSLFTHSSAHLIWPLCNPSYWDSDFPYL